MEKRIDKPNYYLDIAETVATRATCLRKKYGSVKVKNDRQKGGRCAYGKDQVQRQ